jgi:hypothetical protein
MQTQPLTARGWRLRRLVTVLVAVLLAPLFSTPLATATPASSLSPGLAACSTWQYNVVSAGTIRFSPGGDETGVTAWADDKVNVHAFDGPWYKGNFYDYWNRRYYTGGWILSNHLDYVQCW